jgi:hypothetical protein
MTSKSQADFLKTLPQTAANPTAVDAGVPNGRLDVADGTPSGGLVRVQDIVGPLATKTNGKAVAIAKTDVMPDGLYINTR